MHYCQTGILEIFHLLKFNKITLMTTNILRIMKHM